MNALTKRAFFVAVSTSLLTLAAALPIAVADSSQVVISPDVPVDIVGGAVNADVDDAAQFAWQEFIALNWPADTTNGQRDVADTTLPFGDPNYTGPLVWHTFRHKAEVFPGSGDPNGYDVNAADFGYSTLPPVYLYQPTVADNGVVPPCVLGDDSTPYINLDETTQIGLNDMMAGVAPTTDDIPENVNSAPQLIRFLAKGNQTYYIYSVNPNALVDGGDPLYTHPSDCTDSTHTYCVAKANFQAVSTGNGAETQVQEPYVKFPVGTILAKGAWRELNDDEASSGRFYKTTVRYYEDQDDGICYIDAEWGLVGLHIIHKTPTSPNFVFATFEQVDNLLTATGDPVENEDGRFQDDGGEDNSTAPTLVYTDSDADGPALTIVGDPTNPADYCQPETIGDRLYYLELKAAAPNEGFICQNHRDHPIPAHIRRVNRYAHNAIEAYAEDQGFDESPFMYYRLINVQAEPFDKTQIETNKLHANRAPAIFYLANIVVETDYSLQHFSGRLDAGLKTDYPANFDMLNNRQTYQNSLTLDDNGNLISTANMGGCMGCHGVAQGGGGDFSFVLNEGRISGPDTPTAPPTSNPPPGDN